LAGFSAGLIHPDEPPVKAALRQLLDDPTNRWCTPADFRRKIATLHTCARIHRKLLGKNKHLRESDVKEMSEMLNDALTVVVGEPGQPVTTTEAECAHTLLKERGRLINSGRMTDLPDSPRVPKHYSIFSREQQMACAHYAQPELAIPDASRKLASRTGDYAKWAMKHLESVQAGRLVAALLTAPDLPPKHVASLHMLQDNLTLQRQQMLHKLRDMMDKRRQRQ